MLKLLEKLIMQKDGIDKEYGASLRYTQDNRKRLSVIRKVLVQGKELFLSRTHVCTKPEGWILI